MTLSDAELALWCEPLGFGVDRAVAGSVARVVELALRAGRALDAATLAEVERDLREGRVPPRIRAERAAALYYLGAMRASHGAHGWTDALADVAAHRLRRNPPPGVTWSSAERVNPCNFGPCGTGYSPGPSRHFLGLLTNGA
jgi:hypothetical protein